MSLTFGIQNTTTPRSEEVSANATADGHQTRTHISLTNAGFARLVGDLRARGFVIDEIDLSAEVGAAMWGLSQGESGRVAREMEAAIKDGDLAASWRPFATFLSRAARHGQSVTYTASSPPA